VQCTDTSIEGLILSSEDYAVFSKKDWLNNDKKTYYVAWTVMAVEDVFVFRITEAGFHK
jgi:hypothetical protein